MLTILAYTVFFVAISSGSIFCSVRFGRKYEEILPITCMGTVMILFIFGILGILKTGIYVVVLLVITLYILSIALLIKKRNLAEFLLAVVTPGSVIFLVVCIAFAYLNHGRLAYSWDEFSHWMDIVKVMTTLDDFGTNPASQSAYQSYPPGMALFQYFLQKIFLFFKPDARFHEPSVYMAYQVFFASLLLPFFKGQSFRRPLYILLTCTVIFITPILFFDSIYSTVYIDPILSFLAGAGFAAIFLNEDRDRVFSLYIWMLCSMLILTKDSGMLFASLLAVAYCISIFDQSKLSENISSRRKKCQLIGATLLFVFLPKLLWNLELKTSGVRISFGKKVDFVKLWQVLTNQDTTYLSTVFDNWVDDLFNPYISLGDTSITVAYYTLFLAICLFTILLYKFFTLKESQFKLTRKWVLLIMLAEIVIFVFGLCVMYMFKFSEYEAVRLASFTRYVNTVFLAVWLAIELIALRAIDFILSPNKKQTLALILLFSFLAATPVKQIYSFVHRDIVKESIAIRERYAVISTKINEVCDDHSAVYFISQESNGFDYWVTKFSVRPNTLQPLSTNTWSIGENPFYDNDVWTKGITAEQLQENLVQNFDYVALYRLNDYFYENYSVLFEDPAQIEENSVYLVDKHTGLLVFCQ